MTRKQDGFTIVELMIATAVFSLVLLLCSFAIIHVGRMFYRGIITNRTQDTARRVTDDISRAIQFGLASDEAPVHVTGVSFPETGELEAICIAGVRYSFSTQKYLGNDPSSALKHVLWKDYISEGTTCTPRNISPDDPGSDEGQGVELLGENMRVSRLRVDQIGATWQVHVRISHGDDEELFEDPPEETPEDRYSICKGGTATGQFCAVSELKTSVIKRL